MPATGRGQGGSAGFGRSVLQPMRDDPGGANAALWLGGALLGLFLLYLIHALIRRGTGGRQASHAIPPPAPQATTTVSHALVVRPPSPQTTTQPPAIAPVRSGANPTTAHGGANSATVRPPRLDARTLTLPPWVLAELERFRSTPVPFPFPVAAGPLPLAQRRTLPSTEVIARLLVGSLADVDLGAFLARYMQARVLGLSALFPASTPQALHGVTIFETGLQRMFGFYGALLPAPGLECPCLQQAQAFRRLRDAARASDYTLLSLADEINTLATEIDLLPLETLRITQQEYQLCFQASSIRARLGAWRTILAGKHAAAGRALTILKTKCVEKAEADACKFGLTSFITLAQSAGLGSFLVRDAEALLRQLAEAESAFKQLRVYSKPHRNAALVITLPAKVRQELASATGAVTLDEVLDELDRAIFGQLRSAEGPVKKQRVHEAATAERFHKAEEKRKQTADTHTSGTSMENPGPATPTTQAPPPLPAHTQVPNSIGAFSVFARVDWAKVGASSSHGRKIAAQPDLIDAYEKAMANGLIASGSTGQSGIKNEPNNVVIVKISIPDAQGTNVDNRVSLVTRTRDPQSTQGAVYYTFTSAERRH